MAHCSYKNCFNKALPCSKKTFFSLPKDNRRSCWIQNSGNKELLDIIDTTAKRLFCEDHFQEKHKRKQFNRTMLSKDAVPISYGSEEVFETFENMSKDGSIEPRIPIFKTYKRRRINSQTPELEVENEEGDYINIEQLTENDVLPSGEIVHQSGEATVEEQELHFQNDLLENLIVDNENTPDGCIVIDTNETLNEPDRNVPSSSVEESLPPVDEVMQTRKSRRTLSNDNHYSEDEHFVLSLIGPLQRLKAEKKALAKLKILHFLYQLESGVSMDIINLK